MGLNFKELLLRAQAGDQRAKEKLLSLYQPLLMKESVINGIFDEDVYQELCITLLTCINGSNLELEVKRRGRNFLSPLGKYEYVNTLVIRREYAFGM